MSIKVMSSLAAALAARVDQVLPDGFQVSATGTIVSLSTPTEEALRDIDISLALNHVDNFSAAAAVAAWRVLNDFQDDVIAYLWEAWPTAEGHTSPAEAYGESDQGVLRLGYRYSDSTVIDLEPIDLTALCG
ncbi:MAG TPA: hypothetical protein VF003_18465 [Pseudonocardiaceae bacterium]